MKHFAVPVNLMDCAGDLNESLFWTGDKHETDSVLRVFGGMLMGIQTLEANKVNEGEGLVITLSAYVLILDWEVDTLTLYSNIPIGSVIGSSLALDGVAPYLVKADSLGCLVAKFRVEAFGDFEPGSLILTGILVEDVLEVPFTISDSTTVK